VNRRVGYLPELHEEPVHIHPLRSPAPLSDIHPELGCLVAQVCRVISRYAAAELQHPAAEGGSFVGAVRSPFVPDCMFEKRQGVVADDRGLGFVGGESIALEWGFGVGFYLLEEVLGVSTGIIRRKGTMYDLEGLMNLGNAVRARAVARCWRREVACAAVEGLGSHCDTRRVDSTGRWRGGFLPVYALVQSRVSGERKVHQMVKPKLSA